MSEYGIFESLLMEGEQAEKYKAKKAAEKDAREKQNADDDLKANRRANTESKPWIKNGEKDTNLYKQAKRKAPKDEDGFPEFDKMTGKDKDYRVRKDSYRRIDANSAKGKPGSGMTQGDVSRAYDASRRNARRHPTKESALPFV